jgi:hypothetical protein
MNREPFYTYNNKLNINVIKKTLNTKINKIRCDEQKLREIYRNNVKEPNFNIKEWLLNNYISYNDIINNYQLYRDYELLTIIQKLIFEYETNINLHKTHNLKLKNLIEDKNNYIKTLFMIVTILTSILIATFIYICVYFILKI